MILKSKSLRDFCLLPFFWFVLVCLAVESVTTTDDQAEYVLIRGTFRVHSDKGTMHREQKYCSLTTGCPSDMAVSVCLIVHRSSAYRMPTRTTAMHGNS